MMTHKMTKEGFSLMESLVAAFVFALAITGVFASLSAVKKPVTAMDKSLAAARCGQQVLESMRGRVSGADWKLGVYPLGIGTYSIGINTVGVIPALSTFSSCANMTSVSYAVVDSGSGPNGARKVTATVTWPD